MADRQPPGQSPEAEPVTVEVSPHGDLLLRLDDGEELVFDLAELEQAIAEVQADSRASEAA